MRTSPQQRSPEEIDIVASSVIPHQELIARHNMLAKTRSNSLILSLLVPRLDPTDPRLLRKRARLDVRSNARLVVTEQVRILLVKHAVNLQNVGVASGSLKLVASAIETENKGLLRYEDFAAVLMFVTRILGRGFVVVAVLAAFSL